MATMVKQNFKQLLESLFVLIIGFPFVSCSSNDTDDDVIVETPVEEKETIEKYVGVWQSIENEFFFIAISSNGDVSFCFDRYCMGRGTCELEDRNVLTINDTYTGNEDELSINIDANGYLCVKASIKEYGSTDKFNVNQKFSKTDEKHISSFEGDYWESWATLSQKYGNVKRSVSFTGKSSATYERFVVKTGKVLEKYGWYYIPRKKVEKNSSSNTYEHLIAYVHTSLESTPYLMVCDEGLSSDLLK